LCDGGKGGDADPYSNGGGGGGSGGAILLQSAREVVLTSAAALLARGGAPGKGASAGGAGGDGLVRLEDADGRPTFLAPTVTGGIAPAPVEAVATNLASGTGSLALRVAADARIDTETGTLDGQPVPGFQGDGVFALASFDLTQGATLRVEGSRPLTLQAAGEVRIAGTLDLSGEAGENARGLAGGRGGRPRAGGTAGGPGADLALDAASRATVDEARAGMGAGAGKAGASGASDGSGGGASHAGVGTAGLGRDGGAAGAPYGDDALSTLAGGSGGGGGGADTEGEQGGGGGGGSGGGALRVLAAGEILVSGAILADGGPGGDSARGGSGGGGSGGTIHLASATRLRVSGRLSATGGGARGRGGYGGQGRIRLEDPAGSFSAGERSPAPGSGVFATSVALTRWFEAPAARPVYLAVALEARRPGPTALGVELEGADEDVATPGQADPATATGFGPGLDRVQGRRYLRFRITLRSDPDTGESPALVRIRLPVD
ncbi:MAG: hypothetical protein HY722_10735, partial [Planctomycetes bacterium]|nr:hypothetical protein [Planctomycetota bacterium]